MSSNTYSVDNIVFVHKVKRKGVVLEVKDGGKIVVNYGEKTDEFSPKQLSPYKEGHKPNRNSNNQTNRHYRMVKFLHKKFKSPVAEKPTILSGAGDEINVHYAIVLDNLSKEMKALSKEGQGGQVLARGSWMLEELAEFFAAKTLEDQADALTDLQYFDTGTFVEIGLEPEKLFDIVHQSNVAKLWPDGEPRFNEQGKWIKPPGWEAPEPKLRAEISRQIKVSELKKIR
jgi:predicted HAD superfamily Cof-like phosphohydrolase